MSPPIRVLVVDDDEDDFILVQDLLEQIPSPELSVQYCSLPEEAVALLSQGRVDLAFLDHRLGATSGLEVIRQVRQVRPYLPLVLLTGWGSRDLDLEALAAGASDFLVKEDLTVHCLDRCLRYNLTHAEQARGLALWRGMYEGAARAAGLVLVHWDLERDLIELEPGFASRLGFAANPASRAAWMEQVAPEDRAKLTHHLRRCQEEGGPFELEYRILLDQEWRLVRHEASLHSGASGPQLTGFLRDVTREREQEAQNLRRQKMEAIGRLSAGVAHDFNSILTVILTYSEFLLEDLPPDHPALEDAQEIQNAGQRAKALVRRLLGFARRHEAPFEELDLSQVIEESLRLAQPLMQQVEIQCHLEDSALIEGDRASFEQAMINLVLNARDAMPSGGTLEIRTQRAGSFLTVEVSDSGTGVDPEVRDRIFEPFFTTKSEERGTGLGLAVVAEVIRRHGGRIRVEDSPLGGARFQIELPILGVGEGSDFLRKAGIESLKLAPNSSPIVPVLEAGSDGAAE